VSPGYKGNFLFPERFVKEVMRDREVERSVSVLFGGRCQKKTSRLKKSRGEN